VTELMVNLDFACIACESPVGVTLQCAGPNLAAAGRVVASVAVPCPHCHHVNELVFEPNGTLHGVTSRPTPRPLSQPCWN
jgi:hypothetical protein